MLLGGAVLVGLLTGGVATFLLGSPEEPRVLGAVGEVASEPVGNVLTVRAVERPAPPEPPVIESPPLIDTALAVAESADGLLPPWRRFALKVDALPGLPMIAVVIDDMGLDRRRSRGIVALPGPLTVSFLAYARELPLQTAAATAAGHELLLHVPMEPHSPNEDPGPGVLLKGSSKAEVSETLVAALGQFTGYVGINNHMGSRFTEDEAGMQAVMSVLRPRGLLFLDSRTTGQSVGYDVAKAFDVPAIPRDIFIDNDPTTEAVLSALSEVEDIARRKGYAVAIGHPKDATIEALRRWIPLARSRGFALVPVSAVISAQVGSG